MYSDEKINYTKFLGNKPLEKDPAKISEMKAAARAALKDQGINPDFAAFECYADGRISVMLCDQYYKIFDTKTGKFF